MRTKWTFPVYFSALVLAIIATVVGCSRDSTAPQLQSVLSAGPQKAPETQVNPSWAGQYHTDALAFAYSRLSKAERLGTQSGNCRIVVAAVKEFNQSYHKQNGTIGVADAFLTDDVCKPVNAAGDIVQPVDDQSVNYAIAGVSPYAAAMIEQIRQAVASHARAASIVSTVNAIQNTAASTLIPTEAAVVTGVASLAISSVDYWSANSRNWHGLSPASGGLRTQIYTSGIATGPRNSTEDECCAAIALADVNGFLGSLLYSWYYGPIAWEQAAVRGAIASILAALRWVF